MKITFYIFSIVCILSSCKGKYSSTAETVPINEPFIAASFSETKELKPDLNQSIIRWRGTKMNGSRKHEGTLKLKKASLIINDGKLTGGSFIADMNAIGITDIPAHEVDAIQSLTNHLKADFETKAFPYSTFKIVRVKNVNEDSLIVSGNLTIKDVTKGIVIPAKVTTINNQIVFNSKFKLNRNDWKVGAQATWLEKRLVDKFFEIEVELVAEK